MVSKTQIAEREARIEAAVAEAVAATEARVARELAARDDSDMNQARKQVMTRLRQLNR